ncbi:MAG: cytochrome c biogenesis protein CcsA, partial [Candidatus Saccharimonas sp.]|nr:cytochrome c biogenesis protein CcsA [Planctomycetaceae bacterium]
PIDVPELPFKIEVTQLVPNSHLRAASVRDKNPATAGLGIEWFAEPKKPGAGVDTDSKIDMVAAYIALTSRESDKPLGTYLVGMLLSMSGETDTIRVGDKVYELALRPKRYYKDYQFTLKDVKKEDYLGTTTPRNYASTVGIIDKTRNVDEEKTIWMNNPLRFANETFYQSSYHRGQDGVEHTTLSVVANSGWMMPYVSCALVAIGMLAHFLLLLVRFLTRGDAPDVSAAQSAGASSLRAKLGIKPAQSATVAASTLVAPEPASQWLSVAVAATLVVAAGGYIASKAMPPKSSAFEYDLAAFGRIPVVYQGRVKPLETAAQSALLEISGKTAVKLGHEKDAKSIPAIKWMLDVISESDAADEYEVFRIENLELHETMGVKKREGMRYSRKELQPRFNLTNEALAKLKGAQVPEAVLQKLGELKDQRLEGDAFRERLGKLFDRTEMLAFGPMVVRVAERDEFRKQVALARDEAKKDRRKLSVYQRKVLELSDKLSTFDNLQFAFGLHHRIRGDTAEEVIESYKMAIRFEKAIASEGQPVFAVGPVEKDQEWRTLAGAWLDNVVKAVRDKKEADPTVSAWEALFKGYSKEGNPKEFNRAVETFLGQLQAKPPRDVNPTKVSFETFFNRFQPFNVAVRLYLVAFILAACGWLGWTQGFNRAAFWLQVLTLGLHTFALVGRIYISGRPPVTNLYSSAIFVGWGCVVLGLILELIYRIGIGSLIASVAGYATLLIADSLASSGDTFTVLQAVLDTQFWLATHVTCITFGYATTYLAGLFGIVYVLRGLFTPSLTRDIARDLNRMIYGTLCFSIFFSFVGTVLGGLWADDSWGRFWGWDPKENGALIIVLWNALALHARWGGMVKERGLAVLAIAGNIFVSWSWWGVNLLGAGLHAYADADGTSTMLAYLLLFAVSQVALIAIGTIPKQYWRSFRASS